MGILDYAKFTRTEWAGVIEEYGFILLVIGVVAAITSTKLAPIQFMFLGFLMFFGGIFLGSAERQYQKAVEKEELLP